MSNAKLRRFTCVFVLLICVWYHYIHPLELKKLRFPNSPSPLFMKTKLPNTCWTWLPINQWQHNIDIIYEHIGPGSRQVLHSTNNTQCKAKLDSMLENNLKVIDGYPRAENKMLIHLGLDDSGIKLSGYICQQYMSIPLLPVLVTGVSSNHFEELRGLLTNIGQVFNNTIEIIVYDLGLTEEEILIFKEICKKCQYVLFNFSSFPDHVKELNTYTWKPIIIQKTLQYSPIVIWADTSIRFSNKIYQLINMTRYTSVMFNGGSLDTFLMTRPSTFQLLHEEPCLFDKPSVQGGFGIYYRTPLTLKYIMRPWVSCALTKECMALYTSKDSIKYLYSCGDTSKLMFRCHRFDQAVLSILLKRLFGQKRNMLMSEVMMLGSVSIAGRTWPNINQTVTKQTNTV